MIALRFGFLLVAMALLAARPAGAQPLPSPLPMLSDAELTSVCFVDADHGWAVGDRGVIWATSDGGRHWQLQRSPVACRLECVQFLDTLHGWAVGGYTHPITHHTSGVVLRTRDGGRSWELTADRTLPALKQVKFHDARRGWIAGDWSPLYSSGVFRTDTGGKEWTAVPKGSSPGWAAADFPDDRRGVLAGRDGRIAFTTAVEVRPSPTFQFGPRRLGRLLMADPQAGWLVGDGGLIMATRDGGMTWSPPAGTLPPGSGHIDFQALAVYGTHCWIAGNPGTRVLHSGDGGQTWEALRTEQLAPIGALTFLDESRGWAVGSLGTILATRDGGRTWRQQRSGGIRAAMLGVFGEPSRVPLEVIAQQSGSEGFLGVVEIVGRRTEDGADPRGLAQEARTHEAVVAAGGSHAASAWKFPVSPLSVTPQAIVDGWNAANDGQAAARLEEHLVRRIRTWRPEVILTENVNPREGDALSQLVSQLVLAAADRAAQAESYPEQLEHLGLAPWKVKKIFGVQTGERQGTVNVSPSQWSAGLSRSLAEVAEEARSILTDDDRPAPISIGLSLLVDHLPQNTGRRDVFSGIVLLAGGEARRQPLDPPSGNLDELARAAQKRHNVQQLLSRAGKGTGQGATLLAQTGELLEGISDRSAGEILFQLARQHHRGGQGEAAAETMQLLLQRFPDHPLADAAALWLVQHYSSGEMAWRQRQAARTVVQAVAAEDSTSGPFPVATTGTAVAPASTRPASASERIAQDRAAKALAMGRLIERSRPALYADPEFRFPLLTALRAQGEMKQAELFFASLAKNAANDPWGRCAVSEQCLSQGKAEPPKLIISCAAAEQRSKLDGRLDDDLWRAAKLVSLTGAGGDSGADVVLARDDEFLYVAVSCQKVPGGSYEPDPAPRTYDSDLTSRDRVEIHLDIDRDYTSYWSLAVDCRGFTSDRVMGDATWNPTWYVASGGDGQYWTAEIAVPLSELAPPKPKAGQTWAVGIQRLIPNVGLQSATHPASMDVRPEGFGLLRFEQ